MDEKNSWIVNELEQAFDASREYKQKALLLATKELIQEQATRIEQMKGEVDGTMWSPKQWN